MVARIIQDMPAIFPQLYERPITSHYCLPVLISRAYLAWLWEPWTVGERTLTLDEATECSLRKSRMRIKEPAPAQESACTRLVQTLCRNRFGPDQISIRKWNNLSTGIPEGEYTPSQIGSREGCRVAKSEVQTAQQQRSYTLVSLDQTALDASLL